MNIKVKKLHPEAIIPRYQSEGAACFDLHALDEGFVGAPDGWNRSAKPAVNFRTGLAFEIPDGHVMLVFSRSGHGFKSDIRLANCVGVIDSDYRGEVAVRLTADSDEKLLVNPGDRIAQAMVIPVQQVTFEEVDDLTSTERGTGGFGSTGK